MLHDILGYFSRFFTGSGEVEKRVMDLSLSDGALWSVYSTMTSSYLVPLTIFILGKMDPAGLIVGLPFLFVPVAQYFALRASRKAHDLRRVTLIITFIDRVLWLPLLLLLFLRESFLYDVILIVIFLSFRTFFSSFSGTTWTVWVPNMIKEQHRNDYFSIRNLWMRIFSVLGFLIGLLIFFRIPEERNGFAILIVVALLFSTFSLLIMRKIPTSSVYGEEQKPDGSPSTKFSLFLVIVAVWTLGFSATYVYYQYYIFLKGAGSYSGEFYSLIFLLVSISFIVSQLFWRNLANSKGNSKSIQYAFLLALLLPITLLISPGITGIFAGGILIGILQAGIGLNIFNEMIRRSAGNTAKNITLYNLVQSLAQGGGPLIGNGIFIFSGDNVSFIFLFFLVTLVVLVPLQLIYSKGYRISSI